MARIDARSDFVECPQHFNNTLKMTVGKNKAEIAGSGLWKRWPCQTAIDALRCAASPRQQISQSLNNRTIAQKICQPGNVQPVSDRVVKWFGESAADQNGKVGIIASFVRMTVSVDRDDLLRFFDHHFTIRIHAEGAHLFIKGFRVINQL